MPPMDPRTADSIGLSPSQYSQLMGGFNDPYANMPERPDFESLLGHNKLLPSQLQTSRYSDTSGLDAFKQRALNPGTSTWASMLLKRRGLEQANALQDASARTASGAADARSQIAMRGGLTGGAAERIAKSTGRDQMKAAQDIRRQGEISNYDILTNDAQEKDKMMGQLPGMQLQQAQFGADADKFNITNSLAEKRAKDIADLQAYHEKMSGWAAGRQANATENSGKK
jgi:hypothetical protein